MVGSEALTYTELRQTFGTVTGVRFKAVRVSAFILGIGPHLRRLAVKYCSALSLAADVAGGPLIVDTSRTLRDFAVRSTTLLQ